MTDPSNKSGKVEYARLGQITNSRAADPIVRTLENQIVTGALANDSPLPAERDLMEQFGISRTVVREAIAVLSSKGLIESKPRFRPIVKKPDYETALTAVGGIVQLLLANAGDVKNLYDTREFIERALVRQAAISCTREDIKNLKQALAENEKAIGESDKFYATDIAFHRVLYLIPKNPVFPAIHEGFTSWLAPQWDKMLRSPERNLANFNAHKAIYLAILERDPDAAEEALRSHLQQAWHHVSVTFSTDNP